jgi:GPH family glycoside/pentoside/hexuronide:cation symporter
MQLMQVIAGIGFCLIMVVPTPLIPYCLAFGGFGTGGVLTMSYVLFAQVADEDEVRTGVRREGAFFGANALFTKPALSLALALIPFILEATNFVTREEYGGIYLDQPGSAIMGIKMLIGLIPGLAMLIAAFILRFYPLRGSYLAEIQAKVLSMHQEKSIKLDELKH